MDATCWSILWCPSRRQVSWGEDLFNETNWYKESIFALIYATSPAPIDSAYRVFPFDDDEQSYGSPAANQAYYGDLMTTLANEWGSLPVGQYARQWLITVGPTARAMSRPWTREGRRGPSATCPWTTTHRARATCIRGVRGDRMPRRSSSSSARGRARPPPPGRRVVPDRARRQAALRPNTRATPTTWADGTLSDATPSHNGIIYNDVGLAYSLRGRPARRSCAGEHPTYTYAAVDLSDAYRAHASSHLDRDTTRTKATRSGSSSSSNPWRRCSSWIGSSRPRPA